MLKLTLAIFVIWQLAVIIYQFSDAFRNRLGAWPFYLCGLLPTWRMFGPQPVDGDYLLYYRTAETQSPTHPASAAKGPNPAGPPTAAAHKATFSEWQPFDYDQKPHPLLALFFNPRANLVKALREIGQEAAKAGSVNNVYYQLLLNALIQKLTTHPGKANQLLQFQICWKTLTTTTPIFSSHVHPY